VIFHVEGTAFAVPRVSRSREREPFRRASPARLKASRSVDWRWRRVRYDFAMTSKICGTTASVASLVASAAAALLAVTISAQTPATPEAGAAGRTVQSRFPPGPGRDALFKVCNDCHGPESVLGQLKTRDEWSKTLDEMAGNGAVGTDEEWTRILDYLTAHYSLILVNKATAQELQSALDVTPAAADAIVAARTDAGRLKTIDDLKRVPGVEASKVDARKERLVF
jgi:competence protein ComEA